MAGSINDFLSSLKTDLARPARFDIQIPIPLQLIQYRNIAKQITFRCEAAQLPSITLGTIDRKIYGPIEKQPYMTSFNDSMFVMNVSDDMAEKYFFDAWIQLINPNDSYNIRYKADYAVPVTINQYDNQGNLSYSVTLNDAFPISVNQLDLDWSNETMFHKMYVDFAYHNWTQNGIQALAKQALNAGINAGVQSLTEVLNSHSVSKNIPNSPSNSTLDQIYQMNSIAKLFKN